ncbi:geraniol 8-hydroxylase-like, partial [Trifolium pratense]
MAKEILQTHDHFLSNRVIPNAVQVHDQSSLINEAVEIGNMAFKTAINLLSNTIFSLDLVESAGTVGDFKELVVNIMEECGKPNIADLFPSLKMFDPQGIKGRTYAYAGKIIDIFQRLIDHRLKLREVQGFDTNNDMLNTFLNIDQANNQDMNKNKIQHLSLVFSYPFL